MPQALSPSRFFRGCLIPAQDCSSLDFSQLERKLHSETSVHPHLEPLRRFNHENIEVALRQCGRDPSDIALLDVGASIHAFALERAHTLGIRNYVGIDLGITRHWGKGFVEVATPPQRHFLSQMDAHCLWFDDDCFEVVTCLSGFEHYLYPELVLAEIRRVLRPGGIALINYEPIWTCSYGHHLHHFGIDYAQVPPWSHLLLTKPQMAALLVRSVWPAACRISQTEALEWIYDGREINRRDVHFHRRLFDQIPSDRVVWLTAHEDMADVARAAADYASSILGYSKGELLTRGFSCCFRK